ncbi:MAG: mannose-1-phosphate guanylyltransferase/mannose-6-phosphate isomerase [Thermodesulfovibrionales bacterium]
MKAIVLAGGSGTRLWPVSRKGYPKQFMKIQGGQSLLRQTIDRLMSRCEPRDIVVLTNEGYKFHVLEELKQVSGGIEKNVVLEPAGRNTAPAIGLGIAFCREKLKCRDDEVLLVTPSDHIIKPASRFAEYVADAEALAKQGRIVTFGITPDKPETGYGYIRKGRRLDGPAGKRHGGFAVDRFVEKPDLPTAKKYLQSGEYFWNSGMFAFTIKTMAAELKKHAPAIAGCLKRGYEPMLRDFTSLPDISIDYAVMERSKKTAVLPLEITWSDIGSWDSLFEVLDHDGKGNTKVGRVVDVATKNTLLLGTKRLIAAVGLEDLIVVETDDAVLIAKKGQSQRVKEIVSHLKAEDMKEAVEHLTTYRPWGSYTILEEGPRYKIKRIVVKPGQRLSHQLHHHRSEHWIIVQGTAKVMINREETILHENESTYVPKSAPHRLENPGKISLEMIEVQNGEYVEEDDIVRFEDIYGRAGSACAKR